MESKFQALLLLVIGGIVGAITVQAVAHYQPEPLPVAQPVQYDSDIKRMVFAECMKRIQSIKDLDQWYESAHECGEIARWESSI